MAKETCEFATEIEKKTDFYINSTCVGVRTLKLLSNLWKGKAKELLQERGHFIITKSTSVLIPSRVLAGL